MGEAKTVPILPMSYGPGGISWRLSADMVALYVSWGTLARSVSGRPSYDIVTVHHLMDGNVGISVDADALRVYTPSQFRALCEPLNEDVAMANRNSTLN